MVLQMPKISAKRQITLPINQCLVAHINAGDDVEVSVDRIGVISIAKKQPQISKDLLSSVTTNMKISVKES